MSTFRFATGTTPIVSFSGVQRKDFILAAPNGESPVTESLAVVASSGATALTQIQAIERLFGDARERWKGSTGEQPVYPQYGPHHAQIDLADNGTWVRTEILDGRVELTEPISAYNYTTPVTYLIHFTHAAGWEGDEVLLTLTAADGTTTGTLLSVGLFDSFHITAANFNLGNMPARTRIELRNNFNNAAMPETVWLGCIRPYGTSQFWLGQLEAEAGAGGSVQSDAGSYGGQYRQHSWSGSAQSLAQTWTVSGFECEKIAGRRVRPVVRFSTAPAYTDLYIRFAVTYNDVTELATTPWQRARPNISVHEGFTLPLPPRWISWDPSDHQIKMYVRRTSGASSSLGIDRLALMGAEQFIRFKPAGYNLPFGYRIISDALNVSTYITDGGAGLANYDAQGDFIRLMPGMLHSFSVAHVCDTGSAAINRTMQARVYARPRRSTL